MIFSLIFSVVPSFGCVNSNLFLVESCPIPISHVFLLSYLFFCNSPHLWSSLHLNFPISWGHRDSCPLAMATWHWRPCATRRVPPFWAPAPWRPSQAPRLADRPWTNAWCWSWALRGWMGMDVGGCWFQVDGFIYIYIIYYTRIYYIYIHMYIINIITIVNYSIVRYIIMRTMV